MIPDACPICNAQWTVEETETRAIPVYPSAYQMTEQPTWRCPDCRREFDPDTQIGATGELWDGDPCHMAAKRPRPPVM